MRLTMMTGRSVNTFMLLYIQTVILALAHVWAASDIPEQEAAAPRFPEISNRIHETVLAARQLRDSGRRLFGCDRTLPAIQNALGAGGVESCQCVDVDGSESSFVSCIDYCRLCQDELNLCVTYDYAFSFSEGDLTSFVGNLEYSGERSDVIGFEETYGGNGQNIETCSSTVNGVECNSCSLSPGADCGDQVVYDCTNIEPDALFDECQGDFNQIPPTSVFAGYNTNLFNDGDCVTSFPPTGAPASNLSPTAAPTLFAQPEETETPTAGPTRPPFISYFLNRFIIGIQYGELDDSVFIELITNYLLEELNEFFPTLVGLVVDRIAPEVGNVPPDQVEVILEGEAVFLGSAPNQAEFEAAQRFLLYEVVTLQELITSNEPEIGTDVFLLKVLVLPDTLPPTPAPTMEAISKGSGGGGGGKGNAGGKGIGKGKVGWQFKPAKSMKSSSKGMGMSMSVKGKKSKGMSDKKAYKTKKKVASPTYHPPQNNMKWNMNPKGMQPTSPTPSHTAGHKMYRAPIVPTWKMMMSKVSQGHGGGGGQSWGGGGSFTWGGMHDNGAAAIPTGSTPPMNMKNAGTWNQMKTNDRGSMVGGGGGGGTWTRMKNVDSSSPDGIMAGGTWSRVKQSEKNSMGDGGGGTWTRMKKNPVQRPLGGDSNLKAPRTFGTAWGNRKMSSSSSMSNGAWKMTRGGGGYGTWNMMTIMKSGTYYSGQMKMWRYGGGSKMKMGSKSSFGIW